MRSGSYDTVFPDHLAIDAQEAVPGAIDLVLGLADLRRANVVRARVVPDLGEESFQIILPLKRWLLPFDVYWTRSAHRSTANYLPFHRLQSVPPSYDFTHF